MFKFDYGTKQYIDRNSYSSICKLCDDIAKWLGYKQVAKDFFTKNANEKEINVTNSGLQYEIIYEGTGKRPNANDKVLCHYEGSFIDGTIFDSSYKRGVSSGFQIPQVITGLAEGIQLMKEGARYKFLIPSSLAYGSKGVGKIIPHNIELTFDIKLMFVL